MRSPPRRGAPQVDPAYVLLPFPWPLSHISHLAFPLLTNFLVILFRFLVLPILGIATSDEGKEEEEEQEEGEQEEKLNGMFPSFQTDRSL